MLRRLALALAPAVALVVAAAPVHAQRCDTRFDFVNESSRTVNEFYFDRSSRPDFTRDELGRNVLPPGRSMRFAAMYSEPYDLRAVLDNGQRFDLYRINICSITRVVITDRGLVAK
jgi:hypothetical protein